MKRLSDNFMEKVCQAKTKKCGFKNKNMATQWLFTKREFKNPQKAYSHRKCGYLTLKVIVATGL